MLDQYAICPCGSGKKFKWCCQPIHEEIAIAFQQDQDGQHEAALRMMDKVVSQHADNPEAWGKKALLLWQNEKPDEAEAAISKAFEVNPNYPFGHFLRGRFRLFEGEVAGALILFRKAAELYDPNAYQVLLEIFLNIFECEMKLNRPVAARAAAMLALKCDPNNVQLRQGVDEVFSPTNPNLPLAATKIYAFHPTRKVGRDKWEQAMARINTSRLTDVLRAFEELAKADPDDPNVWYNLGLTLAWLGQNAAAIENLGKYVALEPDETLAADAACLIEILRLGQGMEDQSDLVEHAIVAPLRDPQTFVNGLAQLEKDRKVAGLRLDQEQGILTGFALGAAPVTLTPEQESKATRPLGAFFMLIGSVVRVWNVELEKVEATMALFRESLAGAMGEPFASRGPAKFQDIFSPALFIPVKAGSQPEHDEIVANQFARYFEDTWIHKPLKSLDGVPPVDAVGSSVLRKKLLGILSLFEQVAVMGNRPSIYDFSRLRRRLGLLEGGAIEAVPAAAGASSAAASVGAIDAMSAEELQRLPVETLDAAQLELAFQSANKLDAKLIAGTFAKALIERPTRAERPDRYVWHNHLVNLALADGDFVQAIDAINAGEADDCENNGGQRRNDFELRRAQVLCKKGDHDEAADTFQRLIDRVPGEFKYRGSATESMLSARQTARAKSFAEAALGEAKKLNNRDQEGYFQELLEAANRQG